MASLRFRAARGRDDKAHLPYGTGRPSARATHYRDSEWRAHEIKLQVSMERWIDQQRIDLFRALCVLHVRKNMRVNIECERNLWRDPSNQ